MEKKEISVVINTYNAEKFLQRVLDSVKDFDEVVICDMESTDHTVDIAQRARCKVVTFPKGNHTCAEPARTFAIQSAKSPWVLVVDADELVTPELRSYLYQHIDKPDCAKGLYIPRQNRFMNTPKKGFSKDYQLRFFIREGTVWPPHVHTFPQVQGPVEHIDNHLYNVQLIHLAENYLAEMLEKCNRYTTNEVLKKQGKNYGVGALLFRPFWRFFKSYFMNGEIRNGVTGFIDSVMTGFYQFMIVAKVIEARIKKQSEDEQK
ncbi:glycosyltransferase family 2 protein [Prevotella melaninogenica]|uniref:glycosyltransferase family 2 protein n=1 Tax=Prevotella melaninogenica TaxID=28132 RepID=UPI00242AEF54|nr:glycosyltransferase family 2 protein [Prevotella melaninogenica]